MAIDSKPVSKKPKKGKKNKKTKKPASPWAALPMPANAREQKKKAANLLLPPPAGHGGSPGGAVSGSGSADFVFHPGNAGGASGLQTRDSADAFSEGALQPDPEPAHFIDAEFTVPDPEPLHLPDVARDPEVIIQVRGLINRFGKQTVHDGLDLDIHRGEVIGIVGGSGTGKSVLLRTLLGLNRQVAGEIDMFGQPVQDLSGAAGRALRRRLGVLFQDGALFSSLSVLDNVMVPMREHLSLPLATMQGLARMKLGLTGLDPSAADKIPSQLSGGMRKRAGLARALALDPDILFLDEPTAGLDPVGAAAFDRLVLDLQRGLGLTVVMVTHDLDSLYTICDRIAVLIDKKIRVGSPERIGMDPHPWIREYFHGPRARAAHAAGAGGR